jgi:hypothetical protein
LTVLFTTSQYFSEFPEKGNHVLASQIRSMCVPNFEEEYAVIINYVEIILIA